MSTDGNAIRDCEPCRGGHRFSITRMTSASDIAARDDLQEPFIVRIALAKVRVEVNARHLILAAFPGTSWDTLDSTFRRTGETS